MLYSLHMKSMLKKCSKNTVKLALLASSLLFLTGCRVSDVQETEVVLHDAKIHKEDCLRFIEETLKSLPGSKYIKVRKSDNDNVNSIVVTYDAMSIGKKNIEDALALKGFDAGDYKKSEEGRIYLSRDWFPDVREILINVGDADVENKDCVDCMKTTLETMSGFIKLYPTNNVVSVSFDIGEVSREEMEKKLLEKGFNVGLSKATEEARSKLPSEWFIKTEEKN